MVTTQETVITPELIDNAHTYDSYRNLIDSLLEEGRSTGGRDSDSIVHYTKMNVHRMKRLERRTELNEDLKKELEELDSEWIFLVITEGWCGDAAQNVPVIHKIDEASPNITLRLILRDENPEVMDEYLTDGNRAIPKLVVLDADSHEEIGTWGPRPQTARENVRKWKDKYDKKTWAEMLHKWYAEDGTQEIQKEFTGLISKWRTQ